jgi:hypothetical protein
MTLLKTTTRFVALTCLIGVTFVSSAAFPVRSPATRVVSSGSSVNAGTICRLYLDPHDKFTRVGPPQRPWVQKLGVPQAASTLSSITVNYTGFGPFPAAQGAFQAAVNIWSTQVASTVPIVIDADFIDLGGFQSGTIPLGQAGTTSLARTTTTWFPIALATFR